jgi:hypothetical protein
MMKPLIAKKKLTPKNPYCWMPGIDHADPAGNARVRLYEWNTTTAMQAAARATWIPSSLIGAFVELMVAIGWLNRCGPCAGSPRVTAACGAGG